MLSALKKTLLIANFWRSSNRGEARFPQQVATARSQVQVIDGFFCHMAPNIVEVINYLARLHEIMKDLHEVRL
jgi:hypothetical protein